MADVFVSYARPDEPQAKRVTDALRAQGFSVWRDDDLPAHRAYADVIQERLSASKAVVVIWSGAAAKSQWVRAEADAARQAGTLVQATFDGTIPPLPFNQIQCADLTGWDGETEAHGWRKLVASVAALLHGETAEPPVSGNDQRKTRNHLSVCVLPFANMSGDAEQEYFSDGISEDITTDLSKVSALSVTARNTAFTFKGRAVNVCEIARKLDVSHVLEGSVRKAGSRVRITAQLIDGATGEHVWAERYDRDLDDIFALQDEISRAIVDALKIRLLPEEKKAIENRGTANPEAYNLFLMARQAWVNGTHGDPRREETVIRMCDRIIELEPEYGRAWALKALAQAYLFFGYNKGGDNGVEAANRALQLDPALPEAYCVKARAAAAARDFAEAEKQVAFALNLAPDLWEVQNEAGATYIWQRKYREAVPHYEKCIDLAEDDRHSCDMLAMASSSSRMAACTRAGPACGREDAPTGASRGRAEPEQQLRIRRRRKCIGDARRFAARAGVDGTRSSDRSGQPQHALQFRMHSHWLFRRSRNRLGAYCLCVRSSGWVDCPASRYGRRPRPDP